MHREMDATLQTHVPPFEPLQDPAPPPAEAHAMDGRRFSLRIMAHSTDFAQQFDPEARHGGDVKLHWDPENEGEISAMRIAFNRARARGMRGFLLGKRGDEGSEITTFEPGLGDILMIPPIMGGADPFERGDPERRYPGHYASDSWPRTAGVKEAMQELDEAIDEETRRILATPPVRPRRA